MQIDHLTLFGLFSVMLQLICYACEDRNHWYTFVFALGCILGSVYGFLQGAWPFGVVEIFWTIIAFRRWLELKKRPTHSA